MDEHLTSNFLGGIAFAAAVNSPCAGYLPHDQKDILIMTRTQQSMILTTKHALFLSFLLFSMSTIGLGQNVMSLHRYTINSCQLDSVINIVLDDVEEGEIVSVSAQKTGNNHYILFLRVYSINDLHYSPRVLGYMQKQNKTILFRPILNEFLVKDSINHILNIKCIPPSKKDRFLTIPMKDGVKEWIFSLIDGRVILIRKTLKW